MDDVVKGLSEGLADGDLPLGARIAIAREGLDGIELKLKAIAAEQTELAERVQRGEPVSAELERQANELRKLRDQAERKQLLMAGYVAKLERQRTD